jgi:CRP-like cAMP-binding protein
MCPRETVVRLSYNFVKKNLIKDTIIYKQNEVADGIYLVKSGTVQVDRFMIVANSKC